MAKKPIKKKATRRSGENRKQPPELLVEQKRLPTNKNFMTAIEKKHFDRMGSLKYKPEYAELVYKYISESDGCVNKTHVCKFLTVSKLTLLRWMRKYPELKAAVEDGMAIGEARFREKLNEYAFLPASQVNNGIIKLLAANVYGIRDDSTTVVVNTDSSKVDTTELLKQRGIPIPVIPEVDDIDTD